MEMSVVAWAALTVPAYNTPWTPARKTTRVTRIQGANLFGTRLSTNMGYHKVILIIATTPTSSKDAIKDMSGCTSAPK